MGETHTDAPSLGQWVEEQDTPPLQAWGKALQENPPSDSNADGGTADYRVLRVSKELLTPTDGPPPLLTASPSPGPGQTFSKH